MSIMISRLYPWNKLPEIKKTAPEYYETLYYHTSWTKLFFQFLFDREISLFNRILRRDRGRVAITDVSKPDIEMTTNIKTEAVA